MNDPLQALMDPNQPPPPRLAVPLPHLTTLTAQANQAAIDEAKRQSSQRVRAGLSTAEGGEVHAQFDVVRGRTELTGYGKFSRQTGLSAGGEISFDLSPK